MPTSPICNKGNSRRLHAGKHLASSAKKLNVFSTPIVWRNSHCVGGFGYLKKGRTGRFAKTVFYFLRADEKGSCTAAVKGKAVNLENGEGM